MKKKLTSEQITEYDFYEVEGDILKIIDKFQKLYDGSKDKYVKITFEKMKRAYEDGEYISIRGHRLETDEEYSKRLEQEKKWKDQQEARDKAEFERLSKKFKG